MPHAPRVYAARSGASDRLGARRLRMRRTCSRPRRILACRAVHTRSRSRSIGPPQWLPVHPAAKDTSWRAAKWMDGAVEVGVGLDGVAGPCRTIRARHEHRLRPQALPPRAALRRGLSTTRPPTGTASSRPRTASSATTRSATARCSIFSARSRVPSPCASLWLEGGGGGPLRIGLRRRELHRRRDRRRVRPPGKIGWGRWPARCRAYEFQPNRRDRMYSRRLAPRMGDDVTPMYRLIRVGYRFH